MKFSWSTLNVKNMNESIRFYTDIVGLEVVERFEGEPDLEIAFLGSGKTQIELKCDGKTHKPEVGKDISWGFETESLDQTLALMKENGVVVDSGPYQPNPHLRFFCVKDPNGLKIQFLEKIK